MELFTNSDTPRWLKLCADLYVEEQRPATAPFRVTLEAALKTRERIRRDVLKNFPARDDSAPSALSQLAPLRAV